MFGWSMSASACRSVSKRAITSLVSMPNLMILSGTRRIKVSGPLLRGQNGRGGEDVFLSHNGDAGRGILPRRSFMRDSVADGIMNLANSVNVNSGASLAMTGLPPKSDPLAMRVLV